MNLRTNDYPILVAEDSFVTRHILRVLLKDAGLENVFEVENGLDAKQILGERKFDLLIVDWMMPEFSGLELVQWIRLNEMLHIMPIIMVTANSTYDSVLEAASHGVTDFITKPFSLQTIVSKINRALGRGPEGTCVKPGTELPVYFPQKRS